MRGKSAITAIAVVFLIELGLPSASAQSIAPRQLRVRKAAQHYELVEQFRVARKNDGREAFGRVMDVSFDKHGRILVADDSNHRVIVFDRDGQFVSATTNDTSEMGRLDRPWIVSADLNDSVFVWDVSLSKIVVLDPLLTAIRSFSVPPHWIIGGIRLLPNGDLIIEAFGRGEVGVLHVLSRDGELRRTFGMVPTSKGVEGFETSLLGGSIALSLKLLVYSNKSPYRLDFFHPDGTPVSQCEGQRTWTTPPDSVVTRSVLTRQLKWNRFIHSARILALEDSVFLNVVLDPVNNRRIFDIVTPNCTLLNRRILDAPLMPLDARDSRLVAVQGGDVPEIVVFKINKTKVSTKRPTAGPE